MQTTANYQDMSAVDALWTLYRQQPREVRDAFRNRLAESEACSTRLTREPIEPLSLTAEEAKDLTLQRGRDIKAGRAKLIAHEAVMLEMEQMLTSYAD